VCAEDQLNKMTYDNRYQKLGLPETNVYDVQEASGVLALLSGQPLFSYTYPPPAGVKTKELYKLNFFARPTIPWKLECEGEVGKSRPEVVKILQDVPDETSMVSGIRGGYYIMAGLIFVVFQAFFFCCHCMCDCGWLAQPDDKFMHSKAYIGFVFIVIGLLIAGIVIAVNFVKENNSKFLTYETYTVVNGCSDNFTVLPQEEINDVLNESNSAINGVIGGLVVIILLFIIQYGLVVLTACYIKRKYHTKPPRREQDPNG